MANVVSQPSGTVTADTSAFPSSLKPAGDLAAGLAVRVRAFRQSADRRRVVFDPADDDVAIVVSESAAAPLRGELVLHTVRSAERAAVVALLNGTAPLLLTVRPAVGDDVGEQVWLQATGPVEEQHLADGTLLAERFVSVPWVRVAAP